MIYFRYLLIVAAALALVVLASSEQASAQTAPSITVDHAACYQSVIETDDLYCLTRYELPESIADGVSDAWCAELVNQSGCDGTPADPVEPTSLPPNTVFVTLYDGCTGTDCSAGTLLNVSRTPRISYGLGGSYVNAGHSITYGDTDIALCLESSDVLYVTPSIACLPVQWNSGANTVTAQRALLGTDMVEQVRAIGILESQPTGQYVSNNLINSNGKVFALEALSNADRLLDVFSEGAAAVVIPGSTPVAGSTVQANINTSTAGVQTAKTNFGSLWDISGDAVGVLITLGIVAMVFIGGFIFSRGSLVFALITSVSAAGVATLYGLLPFQVLAAFIAVLAMPAAVRVVRVVTR